MVTTTTIGHLTFDRSAVADFCRRWQVAELALFGSALREDFNPDSDVDVLVTFSAGAPWSYWDWSAMSDELQTIFGRPVDLVEKRSVVNPYRRQHILTSQQVIYPHAA
ncbi:MAG: nucleotidyltransferase family protein [Alphaproteobacteria bacterium]|nr:nucleotidyltransferase family protein [Alphaproteobacteria bacterium]